MGPPAISGEDGLPGANTAQLRELRLESIITDIEGNEQGQMKHIN